MLDQTGQVVGDFSCKDTNHRATTVPSAIAELLAGEGTSDVSDVERRDTLTILQTRLHLCRFRHSRRHDQLRRRRFQQTVHPSSPCVAKTGCGNSNSLHSRHGPANSSSPQQKKRSDFRFTYFAASTPRVFSVAAAVAPSTAALTLRSTLRILPSLPM